MPLEMEKGAELMAASTSARSPPPFSGPSSTWLIWSATDASAERSPSSMDPASTTPLPEEPPSEESVPSTAKVLDVAAGGVRACRERRARSTASAATTEMAVERAASSVVDRAPAAAPTARAHAGAARTSCRLDSELGVAVAHVAAEVLASTSWPMSKPEPRRSMPFTLAESGCMPKPRERQCTVQASHCLSVQGHTQFACASVITNSCIDRHTRVVPALSTRTRMRGSCDAINTT